MRRPILFLDDGGVINDNGPRAPQWQHQIAEFFVPRLGGTPDAWAEANRQVLPPLLGRFSVPLEAQGHPEYRSFRRDYQLAWLGGMCERVGVAPPPDDEAFALAEEATAFITRRVHCPMPGAVEAITTLHARGYTLYTASGSHSVELAGYLGALDVAHYFQTLYGADLVDTLKAGPEYYQRIFADAGVEPGQALVLDDSPEAVRWAIGVGAEALLVRSARPAPPDLRSIDRLADLPALLEE